ncbi:MAG: hypothetical protein LCH84_02660 [Gemmatimonadetes bacterium]|nr:hypothetical protein [Gemmatimonadota bacterium]
MTANPLHNRRHDDLPTSLPADAKSSLARLHARAWGVSMGLLLGLGLFVATIWLVAAGGPNVGQHLGLIGVFLPGYSVTVGGAFVGFVYLFVIGYALGRVVSGIYNRVVRDE